MDSYKIMDGKGLAEEIKDNIANEVRAMLQKGLKAPHLAAVIIGEDPPSLTYVNNKEKACREVGFVSSVYRLPLNTSENQLVETIEFLNNDGDIDGFIIQLPVPETINVNRIIEAILPSKDVDGFHPVNVGRMVQNMPCYLPATPYGIMKLIEKYGIETQGKHCVVLGRSQIVGTPMSIMMSRKARFADATVTLCHSRTKNMEDICRSADILIAGLGIPKFVKREMVKEGAVVIDVGISRVPSAETKSGTRLVGDVDFEQVAPLCSYITPVPGGVGPMTIIGLLLNTLSAARKEIYA